MHKPREWEAIRPLFTELYIKENKQLVVIIEMLKERNNFQSTYVDSTPAFKSSLF